MPKAQKRRRGRHQPQAHRGAWRDREAWGRTV